MKDTIARWTDGPFVVALVACAALVLGVFAFAKSAESVESIDTLYTQQGEFSYEAEASAPGLFDSGKVTSGDPVFFRLSDSVTFAFAYRFATDAESVIASSASFVAEVREAGGWRRTIALAEPVTFEGGEATLQGTLQLAEVQAYMDAFVAETGVERAAFSLRVYPDVRSNADVGGEPVSLTFAPPLLFAIDEAQLRLDSGSESDTTSMLTPAEEAVVATSVEVENSLHLLWFSVPVMTARVTAVLLFAAALAGALALAWARRGTGETGPFGGREGVVRVQAGSLLARDAHVVEMDAFADLAAIAEAEATVIFEERWRGGRFVYSVCAHGNVYLWQSSADDNAPVSLAEAA